MTVEYLDAKRIQGQANSSSLGSSADATNTDATLDTTNEKLGTGCLDFNGSSAKLSIVAQANLVQGLTEWSTSFWLWVDDWSAVTDKLIMEQWNTSETDGSVFRIEPQTNQKINIRQRKDDNQATVYTGGTACNGDGTWNHIVFNFYEDSGQKGQLYINGSADSAGVVSFPNDMRANADGTPLSIFASASSGYLEGKIDDIGFWSRKLTTTEIGKLYNNNGGGTAQLVSSLSNKSGLRAYYNCDSATVTNNFLSDKATLLTGGFGSDTTLHVNNNTGNAYHIATSSSYAANGVFVNSAANDALVDAQIQSVSFWLKGSSLTGTITCSAYNADGSLIGNIGTYDISGLTDSWQKIPFTGTTQVLPEDGFLQFHGFGSSTIKINGNATTGTVFEACRTVSLNGTPVKINEGVNCEIVYKPVASLLQENTIFNETDTYKQWWLQDGEWFPSYNPAYAKLFTTNDGWSGDTQKWNYNFHNEKAFGCGTTNTQRAVVKSIPALSATGKWVARFEFKRMSNDGGDGVMISFGSSTFTGNDSALYRFQNDTGYPYGMHIYQANSTNQFFFAGHKQDNNWDGASSASGFTNSAGTTTYCELIHRSDTDVSVNFYTDSAFSTGKVTQDRTFTASTGASSVDFNEVALATLWNSAKEHQISFKNFEVKIGVTSW